MQKFLLLRNNKQTGPYSVEELEKMGLKPYDLIWVNGRSAAWRYPGEIDDLKSFAPPVEEQPYDRFYKKPTEESQKRKEPSKVDSLSDPAPLGNGSSNGNGNGNGNSGNGNSINYAPAANPNQKKEKEYKRVFVTLPNAISNKKAPAVDEPPVPQQPPSFAPQKFAEPIPAVTEKQKPQKTESHTDERNGHSSIDIYYTRRKSFYSRRSFLVSAFAIGILALIGLGMFIGLSLQRPNREAGKQETERVYRVSDKEAKGPGTDAANKDNSGAAANSIQNSAAQVDSAAILANAKKIKNNRSTSVRSQLKDLQQKSEVKPIDSSLLSAAPAKVEPEKKAPEKKAPNLGKLVSVSSNDFQVGPFGGISKLELTVHNTSDYELDLVIVDLEYLKVNKELYKTETLYFKDVGANSSVTIAAPKSSRGNKINYKISLISSKDKLYHASSD
jgi:hypothetical protein